MSRQGNWELIEETHYHKIYVNRRRKKTKVVRRSGITRYYPYVWGERR